MKKIFSVPLISTNARKQSEFYPANTDNLMDYSSSSIDLTDEKRTKLEQLQNRLSVLYEELDKVLVKEEELIVLDYQTKKRKVEPISNFNKSTDNLTECKRSCSSLGNNFYLNDKLNKSEDNLGFKSAKLDQDELDDKRTNDRPPVNETTEIAFSKFYCTSNDSCPIQLDINHNQPDEDSNIIKMQNSNKLTHSQSFNSPIKSKLKNSPIIEQNESNSKDEKTELLMKISDLKAKLTTVITENDQLKSNLDKTIKNEKEIKFNCSRLEEKIRNQKNKIDQLQTRLTESVSNHNKLKLEHEQFKIEMQVEREKFTNFVIEESKFDQRNNQKQLERKLREKDDLIKNLVNEISNLKENLKNKSLTIDLFDRNKLLSSQQLKLDEKIQNISIYQKNNLLEMFMINLDNSSIQDCSLSPSLFNKSSSIGSNSPVKNQLNNKQKNELLKNLTMNSQSNQSKPNESQTTIQLNNSVKEFCSQINLIQKEFNLIADEEERRRFMIKIEDFVLKNMKKLVADKMDTFFDNLQLHLASLKFEIIQFALDNEKKRNQLYSNNRKSNSSLEWIKLLTSNLTSNTTRKQSIKNVYIDSNNQQQLNNIRNRTLRNNNIQSRTVERRTIELKRSIETYLKSYLARILLEMQEQNS